MTDIVTRLRTWFKDVNAVSAIDLMDEAAAEIERLRLCVPPIAGTVPSDGGIGFISVESLGCVAEAQAAYYSEKARISLPDGFEPRSLSNVYGCARPRWVSVDERLPGDETVLLAEASGAWVTIGHKSGDGWYIMECAEANGPREFSQYPFWMPLPGPPEVT